MVRRLTSALALVAMAAAAGAGAAPTVDIAAAQLSWGPHFVLTGTKTEPTYIEHIRLERDRDLFILQGGAPAGMASSQESVTLRFDGTLAHIDCPAGMRCDAAAEPPSGFLASAAHSRRHPPAAIVRPLSPNPLWRSSARLHSR